LRELCRGLQSFCRAEGRGEGLRSPTGTEGGFEASPGDRSRERSVAERASDQDPLRARQTALGGISVAGLLRDAPRVGADRIPLVVHLLAPNQRAVQTTTDLAGFWERLYPQVRRELMRRYPSRLTTSISAPGQSALLVLYNPSFT
jgi:HrpA-like RNA helicase